MHPADALRLRFDGPPIPAEVLLTEPGVPWVKPPPRLLQDQPGTTAPSLGLGPRVSEPRRLDCLRDVDLVWSNLFLHGNRCGTILDQDPRQAVAMVADYPGLSTFAGVFRDGDGFVVPRARLQDATRIAGPVLFATADEPHNWGLWLTYVLPAVLHFIRHRASYHRLFVHADHPNMRAMLRLLGLGAADVILHHCGQAYHFDEVHVFRQGRRDFHVPEAMRDAYAGLRRRVGGSIVLPAGDRIYAGRRRRTMEAGAYRALLNEAELIDRLRPLGFTAIDPEYLHPEEQLALFGGASQVVALGGAGVFNTVFCAPGTRLVDIESSGLHLPHHTDLFASTGLEYGAVIGTEDPADPAPYNRRWTLDAARAVEAIAAVMRG